MCYIESCIKDEEIKECIDQTTQPLKNLIKENLVIFLSNVWSIYGLVDILYYFLYEIDHNDFDLKFAVSKKTLTFSFAFNSANCGRYETYYLNQINNLEETRTGARK